jgi:hypothetical protein
MGGGDEAPTGVAVTRAYDTECDDEPENVEHPLDPFLPITYFTIRKGLTFFKGFTWNWKNDTRS